MYTPIFHINQLDGLVLLASVRLRGLFTKAVLYIHTHTEQGATGIILNHPYPPVGEIRSYIGGPCAKNTAVLLSPAAGHYLRWQDLSVEEAQDHQNTEGRVFKGHARWQKQQLEEEVLAGDWLISTMPPKQVLALDSVRAYQECVRALNLPIDKIVEKVGRA